MFYGLFFIIHVLLSLSPTKVTYTAACDTVYVSVVRKDSILYSAVEYLKKREGYREHPYRCPAGKWTIGIGHQITPQDRFRRLDYFEAIEVMFRDLEKKRRYIRSQIEVPLEFQEETALALLAFNCNMSKFPNSILRLRILEWKANPTTCTKLGLVRQYLKWSKVNGRTHPTLRERRAEELAIFFLGSNLVGGSIEIERIQACLSRRGELERLFLHYGQVCTDRI